ncbi:MAG TPA: PA14 domain-containing protein, partial [Planctomycetaceae bacterium]|nr:PA14 domain-containing protein [Planctomycetaceae bacterium]
DGTSGTGSYVNIGKGVGNKQWYEKRVRPVAAIGLLSSSHFPEKLQGNFLINNCIGVLGVLQHEVKYNGADITAEEIDPIVLSSDENFRPSDLEIGGDGALYIADWHNALIGHMQHNMRDPNRDHQHGRVYRVTYKDRPLLEPARMKGRPIAEVCDHFLAKENGTRYRARLELSGRDSDEVSAEVTAWSASRDVANPSDAQALLECLWVFEEHRLPNANLLATVFRASEPRVRAAAIRTLGHWADEVENWKQLLAAAARDDSALVRAEAVKAAVSFESLAAAEAIFEVATRPTDPELDTVLKYAKSQINVDKIVQDAVDSGQPLSKAAEAYTLLNAPVASLLKLKRTEAVYEAILNRPNVPTVSLKESLDGLATMRKESSSKLLIDLIVEKDKAGQVESARSLGQLLSELPADDLKSIKNQIEKLTSSAKISSVREYAYASWIAADGSGNAALFAASKSKEQLREMIAAIPLVKDPTLRGTLYKDVRSLMFELPPNLESEPASGPTQAGINVEFYYPSPSNVAIETLAKLKPQASGIVPEIVMNVPQKTQNDKFALKFSGFIHTPGPGKYTFYTSSDDGSRLYIDKQLVVNNDGLHGMVEKSGTIELSGGLHPIVVTYFDNGGGDGLNVSWSGQGFQKQKIAADRLSISGGETVHDVAIHSLASIPGHEAEKFLDLAKLIKAGKNRPAAINALNTIPESFWAEKEIPSLVDNLVGYVSTIPASARTGGSATEAMSLARSLAKKLSAESREAIENRLQNLDVPIIAIGTVPARMIYDKERIAVQAGKPVEFRFSNSDHMPHNFAIVLPGALQEVGELAEATANTPDAKERHYIPRSDKILLGSRLLEPGQSQALSFDAPSTPGVYPYVCTYPGHWRRMFGALYVVNDIDAYHANPEEYLAANPLPLQDELLKYTSRNTEWKFEQLIGQVSPIPHGRSFEVGQNLFKVANCVACHKINEEGRNLGPDLTKIEEKKHTTEHILQSILDPSKEIVEKYQSNVIVLDSGKVVTGMIVEETPTQLKVLVDPLAKADPVVIDKSEIDDRTVSKTSIMPVGLLSKLTEEEILDLIAYIYARGDKKNHLFGMHHHE